MTITKFTLVEKTTTTNTVFIVNTSEGDYKRIVTVKSANNEVRKKSVMCFKLNTNLHRWDVASKKEANSIEKYFNQGLK